VRQKSAGFNRWSSFQSCRKQFVYRFDGCYLENISPLRSVEFSLENLSSSDAVHSQAGFVPVEGYDREFERVGFTEIVIIT
jgi:hypothetical protein